MPITMNDSTVSRITYDQDDVEEAFFYDILTFTRDHRVMQSIAITTPPTKTKYYEGQAADVAGVVITGTYSDGTSRILGANEYTYALQENSIVFSHNEDGRILTASVQIQMYGVWKKYTVLGSGYTKQLYMAGVTHEYGTMSAADHGTGLMTEPTFNPSSQTNPGFDFSNGAYTVLTYAAIIHDGCLYFAAGADGLIERVSSAEDIDTNPFFYAHVTSCTRVSMASFNITADVYHLIQSSSQHTKGEFLSTVEAPINTYPDDGEYSGFWYEKTYINSLGESGELA